MDIDVPRHVAIAVAAFLGIAFCQAFNDVIDRDLDRLAGKTRPLAAGQLSLGTARWVSGLCAVGAVLVVSFDPVLSLAEAAVVGLGVLYSCRLRSTILVGNLLVAAVSTSAFLLPYLSVGEIGPPALAGWSFVGLYILGNEIFKTQVDRRGDREYGLRTVATAAPSAASSAALLIATCGMAGLATVLAARLRYGWRVAFICTVLLVLLLQLASLVRLLISTREWIGLDWEGAQTWWKIPWVPAGLLLLMVR
ncbi:4-hydroxybenzoate polyprenyltransferase [Kribbella aluminosa]|uniref:4-hydroxybenzoate polyprenyltransferase n=1 Tax=Kribbella aluminosa TaxID=416017 RepID=A0ABS4UJJ8_9ACTN|nr:4-hydroxybenzoate polyprenyltransferase [Kribbella aluminosa]